MHYVVSKNDFELFAFSIITNTYYFGISLHGKATIINISNSYNVDCIIPTHSAFNKEQISHSDYVKKSTLLFHLYQKRHFKV